MLGAIYPDQYFLNRNSMGSNECNIKPTWIFPPVSYPGLFQSSRVFNDTISDLSHSIAGITLCTWIAASEPISVLPTSKRYVDHLSADLHLSTVV
jgi:hypothetical protein